jgi:hypothetical protein
MPTEKRNRYEYDLPTAVTFLLAGIALGSIVTLCLCPIVDKGATIRAAALQTISPPLRSTD